MPAGTKQLEEKVQPTPEQQEPTSPEPSDESARKRVRFSLFGIIGLCVVGLVDMIYLTYLHWQVHSVPGFTGGFCPGASEAVDCNAVAASPYSELFNVPVSFWGILAYLALIGIVLWSLKGGSKEKPHRGAGLGLLSGAAVGALAVSAALGIISHLFIDSFCSLCMFGYIINIGIAIGVAVSLHALRMGPVKALFQDLSFFFGHPKLATSLGGGGALLGVLTVLLYSSFFETDEEDSQKATVGNPDIHEIAFCDEAPYKGTADAPVVIVEFTDYQCAFCRRSNVQLESLLEPYEGLYRVIHRNYPLDGHCNPAVARKGNGRSCAAAKYALCAQEQGLFWEVNNALFRSRRPLDDEVIREIAEQAGCEMAELEACIDRGVPQEQLARDTSDGDELGVRGTPTFFINGNKLVGIPRPEVLEKVFDGVSEGS